VSQLRRAAFGWLSQQVLLDARFGQITGMGRQRLDVGR
jgi:hypothetical protein